jgi:fused signal recognition particle receptor
MLAVWIVVAIVAVALVVGGAIVIARRRRGAGPTEVAAAGPGLAEAPAGTGPEAPAGTGPEAPAPPADLRERLGRTRSLFAGYVRGLRARSSIDDATWDDLEEALLRADVGVATTTDLLADLRSRVRSGELVGGDAVLDALQADLRAALEPSSDTGLRHEAGVTNVWLFVGVNGVGKTTTIGKVARAQVEAGRSVILAAGDTFRAAAADQLELWAQRAEVPVVRGAEGGDSSAVVFDAVQRAAARGHDLVLADTAGRLHTKVNLVEELKKIRRVSDRDPGTVQEVLLVLDATTGQNGLTQARQFLDAVDVTGVVLTKLDGTAKGGIVVAIQRELGIPVKLVGIGEGPDDLIPFDAGDFVGALFES